DEYVEEQIINQRDMSKLNQMQLEELLNTKQQTIGMMENGKRRATLQDLVKLRKIFNVSVDDFLPKD
ncbi:transcriptional regulator, partial [Streptococcus dysgalactiae subsp. equisimilis]|uniref:helix-turn-helix domain-containing protein n=1 Tax=Streptococcus dysgalactiae TaxID=1334 RepID=UPI00082471FF